MGTPKHLLQAGSTTWIERTAVLLSHVAQRVVISGPGDVPPSLAHLERAGDAREARGPMAGLLGCMRHVPQAAWLVAACDLVDLDLPALRWLTRQRREGVWTVLPRLRRDAPLEPTLALYEPPARPLIARLAQEGQYRLAALACDEHTRCPVVPPHLRHAWRNVNTPQELAERRPPQSRRDACGKDTEDTEKDIEY